MSRGFKAYRRRGGTELRAYRKGEDLSGVSISSADRKAGSPKPGDMVARNPEDHTDQWLVAHDFFKDNYVTEAGGSGYVTAFTRPDPMDPNDRVRQQTQARAGDYPYDMPVSYGRPIGTDSGGSAYQMQPTQRPPTSRSTRASDWRPKDPWQLANEVAEGSLDPYSPGPQAADAFRLGYGDHGRMGEDDDVDMDDLRKAFRSMVPVREPPRVAVGLLSILAAIEDDGSDDDCDGGILSGDDGGMHVYAPNAEEDPEQL